MNHYSDYYDDFACGMLVTLDAPVVIETRDSLVCWIGGEVGWTGTNVGVADNNPLNIKYRAFTSYGITPDGNRRITNVDDGTQGYGTFTTQERGAAATARYLSVNAHGYPAIVAALRAGGPHEVILDNIAKSDWAASHYGYPKTNHLLGYFDFVRAAGHPIAGAPPEPETTPVKFMQLSSGDLAGLASIAIPANTPLEDFAGEQWDTIGPTNVHVLPGLVDAHSNRRAIVVSTGRFYDDGKARPTAQVAVLKGA